MVFYRFYKTTKVAVLSTKLFASCYRAVATRATTLCDPIDSIKKAVLMDSLWTYHGLTMDAPRRKSVSSV